MVKTSMQGHAGQLCACKGQKLNFCAAPRFLSNSQHNWSHPHRDHIKVNEQAQQTCLDCYLTSGCSTNFGDITLTKICVLHFLHQNRHTGDSTGLYLQH